VRAAWWQEQRDEVVDGFLVEPQNQGRAGTTWEPSLSGDWQRLHRVRGVCSGSPENHWVTRLSHKTETEDSTRRCGHPGQFNRPRGAVRPPGSLPSRRFEAEDMHRDRKACVEAKQGCGRWTRRSTEA
jgi:hypothetical protein